MRVEEVEKKGGKEDRSPTMPLMLFSFYRVIRSWRKGRDFFAKLEYKQDGIPSCRGCGHSGVVFYDHYYRKAKVASIDGRICELLNRKHQTAKECMRNIKELKAMMKQMKYEATQEFERLAETISDWFTPIIRMWRFTKNNGITEGFHRKMKLIQRMAYGYRNFENYRLRVLVLCGVFH